MRRLFTIMFFALIGIATVNANADAYRLNEATVSDMFANAELVDFLAPNALAPLADFGSTSTAYFTSDKTPAVAFILAWFIGYLGIHRMYMGTSTGTIIAYIITGGGCGVVWLIDWIVLLIGVVDDDISKYIDNPKFFMW